MSMIPITPVAVGVRWDAFARRPRRLRIGGEDVAITRVDRVRHEAQAYPAKRGPRAVFAVRTPDARLSLVYERRTRRWTVEALDASPMSSALPA
ncbi:MAG TPA: hypothetical protein VFW92_07920 [Candidatus Limnocylindrales bacterium]|nr:hypothetical protein [Candidatus Limnocylindrales bacterium]